MSATFVLRPDIRLVPVRELADDIRAGLPDSDPTAYTLIRDHSRIPSSLVDAEAVALIRQFREPRSLTEAVLCYSLARGLDPSAVLEESYQLLMALIVAEDLVDPGRAQPVRATLSEDEDVAGFRVVRCLRLLDDSEVYAVESGDRLGALKLARADTAFGAAAVRREAVVLARLAGVAGPPLMAQGMHQDRAYVVSAWVDGLDAHRAAQLARNDDSALLDLVVRVAAAYAQLHAYGVLHGDVHPANLLISDTCVTVIDFGLAQVAGLPEPERGGVGPFADPDFAAALVARRPPPPVTADAEQYAVAALLYYLVTGEHYGNFSWDRPVMLRQIVEQVPMPFVQCGRAPWPMLETALARALSKEPGRRYPSMADFQEALRAAVPARRRVSAKTPGLTERLLAEAGYGGPMLARDALPSPTASVTYGAAGVAYGLYRMSLTGPVPQLLALADAWSWRALALASTETGFANSELEIGPATVGTVAPLHTRSGVFAVRALLDVAYGDADAADDAVRSFIAATASPCDDIDLTLGRSGVLLAQTALLEATGLPALAEAGAATCDDVLHRLAASPDLPFLGIAHGVAGVLYALLRWCAATGQSVPLASRSRLDELAALAQRDRGAARWPVHSPGRGPVSYATGWCHGSAGYVHLWILAARLLDRPDLLDLAAQAGAAVRIARPANLSLCCGLAGQAYSQLALYRATGDEAWLASAWSLAAASERISTAGTPHPFSLYKGELGVAVLLADLAAPAYAAMPFFESGG
ncbi:lanthionine synthetase LanC family protein [Streptomyces sp. NPDC093544]|uniref:lanthionine synthetase LanC family protein n=1 Tax=Streptomyces sp. NPDC093544 TaxID=3155200 RepID=UPI00343FFF69